MPSGRSRKNYLSLVSVRNLGHYRLALTFSDGTRRQVDFTEFLKSPPEVFNKLCQRREFSRVSINPVGGLGWECGADLCADVLHEWRHLSLT